MRVSGPLICFNSPQLNFFFAKKIQDASSSPLKRPRRNQPTNTCALCLYSFTDPVTKKTAYAQVAFQVLIRPGSYQVGRTTVERAQPFDTNFSDDELEWSTKERGAVIVTGLLVKITQG